MQLNVIFNTSCQILFQCRKLTLMMMNFSWVDLLELMDKCFALDEWGILDQ